MQLGGDPVVLHNEGGNKNHALRIDFKGLADNKTGIGTKVEIFSNGLWQKFEVAGGAGYLARGRRKFSPGWEKHQRRHRPYAVAHRRAAGRNRCCREQAGSFMELDRRGSSCPTLFAWNGEKYEFITDVIGAGVIGHWISPTSTNTPDPDEWVKIDGSKLRAKDGYLSVRFGEPMEEVNYIDQLRMVAVDHPAGTEVYPDERFLDDPPFASGKTVATSQPHLPAGAWDDQGRDVLHVTQRARPPVRARLYQSTIRGVCQPALLTLDLGAWTPKNPLRLFLLASSSTSARRRCTRRGRRD